ncbi:MAG: hypothetical protein KGK12_00335 [Armatimonadetes bacterium]|nr:hypothetical protein [Armatimonadota bacterium]
MLLPLGRGDVTGTAPEPDAGSTTIPGSERCVPATLGSLLIETVVGFAGGEALAAGAVPAWGAGAGGVESPAPGKKFESTKKPSAKLAAASSMKPRKPDSKAPDLR